MKRKPLTKVRSEWTPVDTGNDRTRWWVRNAHDGRLRALVALEPSGWHLSISHVSHSGDIVRYPSWDEIAHAREVLLPPDKTFAMILPPADEYVALHDSTFHLWEIEGDKSQGRSLEVSRTFFWVEGVPADLQCECKTDETIVVEPDGYTWSRSEAR